MINMDCINGNWIIKYIFEKINEKLSLITYIQKRKLSMHLKTMNKYYLGWHRHAHHRNDCLSTAKKYIKRIYIFSVVGITNSILHF